VIERYSECTPKKERKKKASQPGGFFFGWLPDEEPGGRGYPLPNNHNFSNLLFLRALHLETTQKGNPPGRGWVPAIKSATRLIGCTVTPPL